MAEPIRITDAPLSEKWRLSGSKIQAIDLANLQKALTVTAGHLSGQKVKSFTFGVGTHADEFGNIVYDVNEVIDLPNPLPGNIVDIMLGKTVHESGHLNVQSSQAIDRTLRENGEGEGSPLSYVELTDLGEEVYTDNYVHRSMGVTAPEYLKRARYVDAIKQDPETLKGLHNILLAQYIYGFVPSQGKIDELQEVERTIYHVASALFTIFSREDVLPMKRRALYQDAWRAISAMVGSLVQQKDIAKDMADDTFGFPQSGKSLSKKETQANNVRRANEVLGINPQDEGKRLDDSVKMSRDSTSKEVKEINRKIDNLLRQKGVRNRQKKLDDLRKTLNEAKLAEVRSRDTPETKRAQDLVSSIQEAVDSGTEDMTAIVQKYQNEAFGTLTQFAVVYKNVDKNASEYDKFDQVLYKKLVWLRDLKNTIGKETLRGEERGQVDGHYLYRALIDGKVFKQNRIRNRKDKKIVCLLDASGSMSANKEIYQAAHALAKVVKGTEVLSYRAQVESSYTGERIDTCIIVRQTSAQGFKEVNIGGRTPSGEALVATAEKFPDCLLVHFTDGENNDGIVSSDAFEILKNKFPKIQVVDVNMVGQHARFYEKQAHRPENPNVRSVYINYVSEFPEILQESIKPWVRGGS